MERRTDTDVLLESLCVRLNVAGGEAEHEGVSVSRPAETVALKMKMLAAQKAHDEQLNEVGDLKNLLL